MKHAAIILSIVTNFFFYSNLAAAQNNNNNEDYWLKDTSGPYATGTVIYNWIDEQRDELSTSIPDDKRHVTVQIWYPAEQVENPNYATYASTLELYAPYVVDWGAQFSERLTKSMLNVPVAIDNATYPIIIYSPGGGAPVFTGTSQTEFLASYGYVVVSVEHIDTSGRLLYSDGTEYNRDVIPERPSEEQLADWSNLQLFQWGAEQLQDRFTQHVRDISFALDELEALNTNDESIFYQRLDTDQTGAIGWSSGGATDFQATVDDSRIKAAINLDGGVYGRSIVDRGSDKPLLLIESTFTRFNLLTSDEADPAREEIMSYQESLHWKMFSLTTADWYRAKLLGSQHTHFSDLVMGFEPPDENLLEYKTAHNIINELALEFFGKYINGNEEMPLLSRDKIYPELRIITKAD